MYHELPNFWKDLLLQGLAEDGWPWDWTTLGIQKTNSRKVQAKLLAKSNGVWAAQPLSEALISLAKTLNIREVLRDGQPFKSGDSLLQIEGELEEILALERPYLNLAAYVSGIATATQRIVHQVGKIRSQIPPRVTLTRKTLPGYRDLAIHGVRTGGGFPHRTSLSSGVLIKENHIRSAGSITLAVQQARAVAPHLLKIEVEVTNLDEFQEALAIQADGILLDNFRAPEIPIALQRLPRSGPRPFIEISGGLNETTIADYVLEGVDILSVGALTHSVSSCDFSLLIQ